MSEERLLRRRGPESGTRLGLPYGGRLPEVGIGRGLGLVSGLCTSQILSSRSQSIHNFSITDGRLL